MNTMVVSSQDKNGDETQNSSINAERKKSFTY